MLVLVSYYKKRVGCHQTVVGDILREVAKLPEPLNLQEIAARVGLSQPQVTAILSETAKLPELINLQEIAERGG